jgi:hypothetical protein
MTAQLAEMNLGEGARDYARKVLEGGGPLSRAIAPRLDRLTRLYTWAPPRSDPDWVDLHVDHAGVLVPPPMPAPGSMVPIVDSSRGLLLGRVSSYLKRANACLVIDDPWRKPEDIQRLALAAVTYDGEHVAHVDFQSRTSEALDATLRGVLTWEWCGVLLRDGEVSRMVFSGEWIDTIAGAAEHLFLPAFDHEGWIMVDL